MSKPSNSSKDRWNAARYTQVKISINTDTAAVFKAACALNNVSMDSVLSEFMAAYSEKGVKASANVKPFATRKKRRKAIKDIISQMEELMSAEEDYKENIPENLQGSKWYEAAEQSLNQVQEAIYLLEEAY